MSVVGVVDVAGFASVDNFERTTIPLRSHTEDNYGMVCISKVGF